MSFTSDEVKHVAKLANLPLTLEEEEKYGEQLSRILEYVDQLDKVDTKGIEPTFNVSGQKNVMRKDETVVSLSQEDVLPNASKQENSFFVTKGVFDNE